MGLGHLIGFLIVGAIAGWLAGVLVKGRGFGLLGDIVVGVVGSYIAGHLGLYIHFGLIGSILSATLGAVLLLALVRLFARD